MTYILVILNLQGGPASFLEFRDLETCQAARQVLASEMNLGLRSNIRAACVIGGIR